VTPARAVLTDAERLLGWQDRTGGGYERKSNAGLTPDSGRSLCQICIFFLAIVLFHSDDKANAKYFAPILSNTGYAVFLDNLRILLRHAADCPAQFSTILVSAVSWKRRSHDNRIRRRQQQCCSLAI
jgi:hypothetical protein